MKKVLEQKLGLADMLEIKCPYCGERSQNEFEYGGDATIKRPKLNTEVSDICLLYTSPSPRDGLLSRMPSSA